MLFNSFTFIVFLLLVLTGFFILRSSASKKIFILIASYFFYSYWDYRFCLLLIAITTIDFVVGKKIYSTQDQGIKKKLLIISLVSNLGTLFFFKYFNFFVDNFHFLDFLHINVLLPLGLSFYVFKSLSYTLDIYFERLKPTDSFIDYAFFVSFFPQLIAGPIDRARSFLPQLANLKSPSSEKIKSGFYLLTMGMLKKVLIGDACGKIVDQIFAQPQYYVSSEILMGIILFSIQIYADFSGYSDISRGIAKFLGLETMENFKLPYLSSNIIEFWRRWHISLTSWFRDYVFTPLSLSLRGIKPGVYISIFIMFLASGLWHGANWTFIAWGAIHGIYLIIYTLFAKIKKVPTRLRKFKFVLGVLLTNILVTLAWVLFRSESFSEAAFIFSKIAHWESGAYDFRVFLISITFLSFSFLLDVFEYYYNNGIIRRFKTEYSLGLALGIWLIIFIYIYSGTPAPFIYSQF